jgi:hypothetical protein
MALAEVTGRSAVLVPRALRQRSSAGPAGLAGAWYSRPGSRLQASGRTGAK